MQTSYIKTEKALLLHTIQTEDLQVLALEDQTHFIGGRDTSMSLTVHDIKQAPDGPVLGAGRVLSEADKQEIRDYLNGESMIRDCWLPENLMMLNNKQMVWYVPAKKRPMYIKKKGKVISKVLMWPSLVFRFTSDRKLYVAAYAGSRRPSLDQPLYHAPLWNIYHDSHLCTGSATTTDVISVDAMTIWEDAIFETVFTHPNHAYVLSTNLNKQRIGKTSQAAYIKFIEKKCKSGERFKASEMQPLGRRLEQWVN